ncbi:uncharacterized protein LOC132637534 [Lycium barbarum]|uniref:uncharacterized protein LOC132637534 n=1 Tax=Lycium barbarum TaxID=112863 RepID=UPI00293F347A|nr:uncharacterized protein LOC132637534 [Lycium barbarum]
MGNPGIGSNGFCIRDEIGDLVYAQAEEIGHVTNNEAEICAIVQAVRCCNSKNLNNIIIQTGSQLIQKILEEEWKPPWNIAVWVDEIRELVGHIQISYTHILREGNKLADALANHVTDNGRVDNIINPTAGPDDYHQSSRIEEKISQD